jgi:hypothetical protein
MFYVGIINIWLYYYLDEIVLQNVRIFHFVDACAIVGKQFC